MVMLNIFNIKHANFFFNEYNNLMFVQPRVVTPVWVSWAKYQCFQQPLRAKVGLSESLKCQCS